MAVMGLRDVVFGEVAGCASWVRHTGDSWYLQLYKAPDVYRDCADPFRTPLRLWFCARDDLPYYSGDSAEYFPR